MHIIFEGANGIFIIAKIRSKAFAGWSGFFGNKVKITVTAYRIARRGKKVVSFAVCQTEKEAQIIKQEFIKEHPKVIVEIICN